MPTNPQSHEPQDRSTPRGFLDPASPDNEEYGTAQRQSGAYWYRTSGARAEGIDDEDVAFGGYDPDAPESGRKRGSDGRPAN
jgi:hypothetical protein